MLTLLELAHISGSDLQGDPDCIISNVASIDKATQGEVSFVRENKYKIHLSKTKASAVILPENMANDFSGNKLINSDPYLAYAKIVEALFPIENPNWGIHPSATIHKTATIAANVYIGENVVIGENSEIKSQAIIGAGCAIAKNCSVGRYTELKPNVTLYDACKLGEHCLIHSGAILGADGFGFVPQKEGKWYKIPQIGNVILGDNVEIGANTCIDRAALGSTTIGNGVKLDNLIQIGHNVTIGDDTAVAAHTAIAGSVKIGKRCRIAGAVAIAGHLEIVDDVTITGRSLISHAIRKSGVYSSGIVASENHIWRKNVARFRKLDDLFRRVITLEKNVLKGHKK